jgi:hypothetical protein
MVLLELLVAELGLAVEEELLVIQSWKALTLSLLTPMEPMELTV